ncbi:hypothetical protein AGDE_07972 [Angomonas deanei]|nr:hypothetical protein AGDE_07972 [Angomonas deanei]|eukprot:EPY34120.1 hypothetical protein AGDE_07972 [Angomonas deanei]
MYFCSDSILVHGADSPPFSLPRCDLLHGLTTHYGSSAPHFCFIGVVFFSCSPQRLVNRNNNKYITIIKQPMPTPARDVSAAAPLSVVLSSEKEKLPSTDYIRVVSLTANSDEKVIRSDFALHNRGARLCRLLEPLLDSIDVDFKSKFDPITGPIPPLTLPQATEEGCACVFKYLDLLQTRVPTLISKPLRAPLEELVQPWEMNFLISDCFGLPASPDSFKSTSSFARELVKKGNQPLDRILEVAMLADFLIIDHLRDLTCAFVASLGLSASTDKDLMCLCGLGAPVTDDALEPLYSQYPFLRSQDIDYC